MVQLKQFLKYIKKCLCFNSIDFTLCNNEKYVTIKYKKKEWIMCTIF